jgi:mannose-6-phosphate isomerase-like protein (cupin superfamily)
VLKRDPSPQAPPLAGHTLVSKEGTLALAEWADEGESSAERPIAGLHLHREDDEAWYVLEGVLGFRLGGKTVEAPAGSAVLAPAGTPHAYWNAGEGRARYLLIAPPRLFKLIEELHEPGADFNEIFRKYDSELLSA